MLQQKEMLYKYYSKTTKNQFFILKEIISKNLTTILHRGIIFETLKQI
jgi:hypothetical protein